MASSSPSLKLSHNSTLQGDDCLPGGTKGLPELRRASFPLPIKTHRGPISGPRRCALGNSGTLLFEFYPRNPIFDVWKLAKFGKMEGKSVAATPNHVASIAAY